MSIEITWDKSVSKRYPSLALGYCTIRGVNVKERSDEMDKFIKGKEEQLANSYSLEELKNVRIIRLYRDFFWRLGIDPTKKRPASEALLRRILRGKGLPRISNVVDAYNLASAESLITLSAYDLDKIEPPLMVRFAKQGEEVILIGMRKRVLSGNEIVLSDRRGILCVLVHGDVERTKVTKDTRNVLIVAYGAPGIDDSLLIHAIKLATTYIVKFAGGVATQPKIVRGSDERISADK
ncbi:MAG: hypothetical protein DRJ66_02995 [Thermoprotei archaeon]|nr:MAG: hypothetical protein DRJ66_02995 [Thermoprotei archaeon]RLF20734.1 MAG: hypothetical protein DRZ82_01110 [Thermoprotei archaeon]